MSSSVQGFGHGVACSQEGGGSILTMGLLCVGCGAGQPHRIRYSMAPCRLDTTLHPPAPGGGGGARPLPQAPPYRGRGGAGGSARAEGGEERPLLEVEDTTLTATTITTTITTTTTTTPRTGRSRPQRDGDPELTIPPRRSVTSS